MRYIYFLAYNAKTKERKGKKETGYKHTVNYWSDMRGFEIRFISFQSLKMNPRKTLCHVIDP
jgi:nitrous oxidase accessory protein NosD